IPCHTLDLVITRSSSTFFSEVDYTDPSLSDHSAILSSCSVPSHSRCPRITKLIRNIKSIDTNLFSSDLLSSSLYTHPACTLNSYLFQFSSTLSKLLDKHAPLRTISCPSKTRQPFITQEIINEKRIRSRLETIHRHDKSCPIKKANFNQQAKRVAKLITVARRNYFCNLISNCSAQPKKLWTALNSVLSRNTCLPTCHSTAQLATSFMD